MPELAARDHLRKLPSLLEKVLGPTGPGQPPVDAVAYTAGPGSGRGLAGRRGGRRAAWPTPGTCRRSGVHHLEGAPARAAARTGPAAVSVSRPARLGRAHAARARSRRSGATGSSGRVSMTLRAKRSTRPRSCSVWVSRADRSLRARRARAARRVSISAAAARSPRARLQLQRSQDGRRRRDARSHARRAGSCRCRARVRGGRRRYARRSSASARSRRPAARTLVVAGGVGANQRLRTRLRALGDALGVRVVFPRPEFCTDNAAMIALAGCLRLQAGEQRRRSSCAPARRWPLERPLAPPRARLSRNARSNFRRWIRFS